MNTSTEAIWRVTYISCHKLSLALNMKTNISTIFVQFRTYQQVLQFNLYYIGHVILNLLLRSHISTDHDRIDCSLSDVTYSQALNPNIRTYCAIQLQSNYKDIDSDSPCVSRQLSACCYADKVFSSTILKTCRVRGTEHSFLLLVRSADRRCDRQTDRQTDVHDKGALGLLVLSNTLKPGSRYSILNHQYN